MELDIEKFEPNSTCCKMQNDSIHGIRNLTLELMNGNNIQDSYNVTIRFLPPDPLIPEFPIKYFNCTLEGFGGYHTQLIKFINGTERYEFKIEDLDLDSIYYLNIYTQYENDTKGHISSRRTFKYEIPRGYQVDVRFKGNIQIGDFSLNATISMARMIKLNDGLAVQVFWDFASEIKLFCVSMVSTYPGKNFSKKATIWGKTYHIFENVEPKNEYRISIRLCPLFLKHKYYYTTHQVFITAP
ncbi:uncharacterized protein LOC135929896 isoform X2 [Gordionus sp. m RMFG-2023]|uniref:uncharacterized protein LOC135929896 isoform X2 n=1 Tax=Gordionus sp. m RMFG-2023 TaxID=3053472 RepID=UPI0031FDA238